MAIGIFKKGVFSKETEKEEKKPVVITHSRWLEMNERKGFSCQDCVYKLNTTSGIKTCELSKKPVENVINGVSYPIRWDKCEGYKMIKSCDNCGNLKESTLMVADRPMLIEFCPYKFNECKEHSLWLSRKESIDKVVIRQKSGLDKIKDAILPAKSEPKTEKNVEIPVVDKEEPKEEPIAISNPVIKGIVGEISTTMKEEEEKRQEVPPEEAKEKEIEEEQALHEEHINTILETIAKPMEEAHEQMVAEPIPVPQEIDEDEPTIAEAMKEEAEEEFVRINYDDYERLPGESRRQFKRRVRKELGLSD